MKPLQSSDRAKIIWQRRLERSGTFLAIAILNFVLFLLVGTAVIYHLVVPEKVDPMVAVKIKQQTPPPKPPAHGGEASKSLVDPTTVVVPPPVSAATLVTSSNPALTFNINTSSEVSVAALPTFTAQSSGAGLGSGTSGGGAMHSNPFGDAITNGATPALVGYFYDLKQTSGANPQASGISQDDWKKVMLKLVASGLDESVLSDYLKSPEPRSTGGFAIPEQASENAPDAFGLAGKVDPNLWAAVYHGKAVAPKDMRFRFVGFGDDTLVIRADGQYVLDAGWQFMRDDPGLHETYPYVWSQLAGDNAKLRIGKWIDVRQGQTVNFDMLIGDWGGECGYFLMIEVDGETYKKMSDGTPILPLFQIGSKIPIPTDPETPPISDSDSLWTPALN